MATRDRAPRPWGYWTELKLTDFSDYLDAFLTACQSDREVACRIRRWGALDSQRQVVPPRQLFADGLVVSVLELLERLQLVEDIWAMHLVVARDGVRVPAVTDRSTGDL